MLFIFRKKQKIYIFLTGQDQENIECEGSVVKIIGPS